MSKPSTVMLYGIANCDTVKRARVWLGEHDVAHSFYDFKKSGVPAPRLDAWEKSAGWERLVNRQGTTWRKLDDASKSGVVDATSAKALMREQASIIKRPVVEWSDGSITVGFDADDWGRRLKPTA